MRNPTLYQRRNIDVGMLSKLPTELSDDVIAVIEEIAAGYVNPWRTWEILTDIRNRIASLSEDDEATLYRFGVLHRVDPDIAFDSEHPENIVRILLALAAPHIAVTKTSVGERDPACEIRAALLDAFAVTPSELAFSLCEIGEISPETARALLEGRIATAKRLWTHVSPDEQAGLDPTFDAILADLLVFHLLDSLWQAGCDTARRRFQPTGSPVIDGVNGKEAKLGGIRARVKEIEVAIGILDRIAATEDKITQKEQLELVFAPILGLARSWESELQRKHGKALKALLVTWNTTGRQIAEAAADRICKEIDKVYEAAGPGGKYSAGGRDYLNYIGGVNETFYLAVQCGAWWTEERLAHVARSDEVATPLPQALNFLSSFKTLYVCITAFAINSARHDRKHLAKAAKSAGEATGRDETLVTLLAAIDKSFSTYVTEVAKPAEKLWARHFANDWERRCFETECYGRFWLRLHL